MPLQSEGSSVRAGESLPGLGSGVAVASQTSHFNEHPSEPTRPPAGHAGALRARAILTAGGIFGERYNKLHVQESTIF